MTFDALLANLRHISTNGGRQAKISSNLVVVFYCHFNVYYSYEETKLRSNSRWQYGIPKWYEIVKRLRTSALEESADWALLSSFFDDSNLHISVFN